MDIQEALLKQAVPLIDTEVRSIAVFHRTRSSEADRQVLEARADLLPLLREAAELQDIDLLLRIERAYLETELRHLVHTKESLESFTKAVRQVRAAFVMLGYVRDPDIYQWVEHIFTLSETFIYGLPKDAAHEFFASHGPRLRNLLRMPPDEDKAILINARINNTKLARSLYIELQRQALTAQEVQESSRPYTPERKLKLAA